VHAPCALAWRWRRQRARAQTRARRCVGGPLGTATRPRRALLSLCLHSSQRDRIRAGGGVGASAGAHALSAFFVCSSPATHVLRRVRCVRAKSQPLAKRASHAGGEGLSLCGGAGHGREHAGGENPRLGRVEGARAPSTNVVQQLALPSCRLGRLHLFRHPADRQHAELSHRDRANFHAHSETLRLLPWSP
jgi:hypothetical protein